MPGVDDFAVERGRHYGTVPIDCKNHRVLDLVEERDASQLAGWLLEHGLQRGSAGTRQALMPLDGARTERRKRCIALVEVLLLHRHMPHEHVVAGGPPPCGLGALIADAVALQARPFAYTAVKR